MLRMKVILTTDELNVLNVWRSFCDMRGRSPYDRDDGWLVRDTEHTLTAAEVRDLGIALPVLNAFLTGEEIAQ